MPNSEQMAKLREFLDVGQIKRINTQRYKNGETIVIDTGSEVLWWWEFLERDSATGSEGHYFKEVQTMVKTLCGG